MEFGRLMLEKHNGGELAALYRTMRVIRLVEQRLSTLFAAGEIPGFIHLSIGQEAVAAGIMSALHRTDTVASNHRGHGHALAKGIPLTLFFLELLAREGGACKGRGGSMHVADLSVGMLGANGIVAAGIPLALGSALAHKALRSGAIAVAFFGDGALAEGVLHESLNMASLLRLPLLFACENNGWAEFSKGGTQFVADVHALAAAFRIPTRSVDGNDVRAVAAAAHALVDEVRRDGPRLLECITTRVHGHFEGDAQKYRAATELAELGSRDPLVRARADLMAIGMSETDCDALDATVEAEVAAAVEVARAGKPPDMAAASADVYTPTRAA